MEIKRIFFCSFILFIAFFMIFVIEDSPPLLPKMSILNLDEENKKISGKSGFLTPEDGWTDCF